MATVRIEVTQDDIDLGIRGAACLCPIARAGARRVPARYLVSVDGHVFDLFSDEKGRPDCTRRLPDEAVAFVAEFDRGESVAPISFDLDIPDDLLAPTP
jgi:hypothetical protein